MEQKTIIRILEMYGLAAVRFLKPQKGYRNTSYAFEADDGAMYNLILYKDEPGILERIKRADESAVYLASQNLPVRKPLGALACIQSGRSSRYARLYNYLPGVTIPWEAYTMGHIKLLGKTMGIMHNALKSLPQEILDTLPNIVDVCQTQLRQMEAYFEGEGVYVALRNKLDLSPPSEYYYFMNRSLDACRRFPGNQALHMDFVRGNILFSQQPEKSAIFLDCSGKPPFVSGVLDFEKVAYGSPAFDVARTLAFLIVDCKYKQAEKVEKYFLHSGYLKRGSGPMDEHQIKVAPGLVSFFLLHDFYKFLKHNPYESLAENEHFKRTRDILLKDGMISRIAPYKTSSNTA